jgi:hypothetical protein
MADIAPPQNLGPLQKQRPPKIAPRAHRDTGPVEPCRHDFQLDFRPTSSRRSSAAIKIFRKPI